MHRDDSEPTAPKRFVTRTVLMSTCVVAALTGCRGQRMVGDVIDEVSVSSAVAYRLPILPVPDGGAEIDFYLERIRRNPTGGLDFAELAGAYLARAKRTHDHSWLARAGDAAERSLENLAVSNTKARLVLAAVAQEHHEFATALGLVGEILATRPTHVGALSIAATSHLALGDPEAALAVAKTWVEHEPTQPSLSHRAVILAASGHDEAALSDFERALDAEQMGEVEASSWTRTMLGRFHMRRGRTTAARAAFAEAQRIAPESTLPRAARAELEARYGDPELAEKLYLELQWATRQPIWSSKAATLFAARGDDEVAARFWDVAIEELGADLEHGHSDHRRDLANALLDRGDVGDIAEALALAASEAETRRDADTVLCYTWALLRADQVGKARAVVREALAAGLNDARLFERSAQLAQLEGDSVQARLHRRKADARNPSRSRDRIGRRRAALAQPVSSAVARAAPPRSRRVHHHGDGDLDHHRGD